MIAPEQLYWWCLVLLVVPSLAFNRIAGVVLSVWVFGHIVHTISSFECVAYMCARILAIGVGFALMGEDDGSLAYKARLFAVCMFIPSAFLTGVLGVIGDPMTQDEYQYSLVAYYGCLAAIVAQAISIPLGIDRGTVKRYIEAYT